MDVYAERLARAYSGAFQVALKAAYVTPSTIVPLLSMAAQNVRNVALEASYMTSETAPELIARANSQAVNLAKAVGRAQAKL